VVKDLERYVIIILSNKVAVKERKGVVSCLLKSVLDSFAGFIVDSGGHTDNPSAAGQASIS
jgi:hypothetical protein